MLSKMVPFVVLWLSLSPALLQAGTCKGEDPCKQCANCKACKYCNSGKGSCSVYREQADREYEARKRAQQAGLSIANGKL
jgi:hypothetical protein